MMERIEHGRLPYPYISYDTSQDEVKRLFSNIPKGRFLETNVDHSNLVFLYFEDKGLFPLRFRNELVSLKYSGSNYSNADRITDFFTEDQRIRATRYNKPSTYQLWYNFILSYQRKDRITFLESVQRQLSTKEYPLPSDINYAIWESNKDAPNNFPVTICHEVLRRVFNTDTFTGLKWLDMSAGWGDRMIAAAAMNMYYTGFDPNTSLLFGYQQIKQLLDPQDRITYSMIPFEESTLQNGEYDVAFTSPPFFDVEVYQKDDINQSINKFSTYELWMSEFMLPSLRKMWDAIRLEGYLVLYIADSKQLKFSEQVNLYIKNSLSGAQYEGVMVIESGSGNPKPIWVWKKRAITSLKEIVTTDERILIEEYNGYLKTKAVIEYINTTYRKTSYKLLDILENWFMENCNTDNPKETRFSGSEVGNKDFIDLVTSKNLVPNARQGARDLLDTILDMLAIEYDSSNDNNYITSLGLLGPNPDVDKVKEWELNSTVLRYGTYSVIINNERLDILRSKTTDEKIMAMFLRYASIASNMRQFAVNIDVFRKYVDLGASIEGFASPYNAQILRCGPNYKFCSLFIDTDEVFGSLGSFFSNDFSGSYVIANPPKVLNIIQDTVNYCMLQIERGNSKFSIIVPEWKDAPFFISLSESKYLVMTELFESGKFHSENPLTGEKQLPPFNFVMFTIQSVDWKD